MRTLYVRLPDGAIDRLAELARREFREPKAQAGLLILEGLRRAGLDPERSGTVRTAAERRERRP